MWAGLPEGATDFTRFCFRFAFAERKRSTKPHLTDRARPTVQAAFASTRRCAFAQASGMSSLICQFVIDGKRVSTSLR